MKGFMFRKVTSLILVLLMIASTMVVVPFSVTAAEADLTIGTPAELVAFKQAIADGNDYAGKTIKLTADIDMSGVENWPITNKKFNGTFDGDGYAIKNLKGENTTTNEAGLLFGHLGNATVQNLILVDAIYTGSRICMGLIAGNAQDGASTLRNLYVDGTVTSAGGGDAAILLGRVEKWAEDTSVTIENCVVDGSVTSSSNGMLAGVVARVKNNASLAVSNCAFIGDIKREGGNYETGVFWGYVESGTVTLTNCANMGTVTRLTGSVSTETDVDTITPENFATQFAGKYAGWTQTGAAEMMPASVAEMLGKKYIPTNLYYQRATALNNDGTIDVRFVTVINSLDYAEIGFNITVTRTADGDPETSAKVPFTTTTVYESISAHGETVTAEKLGGQYIVAIVIEGIDCANYAHEITVEAFVKETAGGEATPTATGTVSLAKNAA